MTRDQVDKATEPQLDVWVAVHVDGWTAETTADGRAWWLRDEGQKMAPARLEPFHGIRDRKAAS